MHRCMRGWAMADLGRPRFPSPLHHPRRRAGDGEQGQHRGRGSASVGLTLAVTITHARAHSHLCHCLALPRSVILVDPGRRGSVSFPAHTAGQATATGSFYTR
ncbi:hypothetical protein CCHR01_12360 [Colletotrichum chrysophilum]|uniref:Uncharacterized protein n=1 Tax=Colletotrichum chrysophilum TaxID=1836956 RepID=A0AAD9EER9_9PEZI|nr:hypothetical protein CCHR01_12360 [Colletotrichum chrysophilum]